MTRARIADGLETLALQLASPRAGDNGVPPGWEPHEWDHIKGLAAGAIWTWRARLVVVGQS